MQNWWKWWKFSSQSTSPLRPSLHFFETLNIFPEISIRLMEVKWTRKASKNPKWLDGKVKKSLTGELKTSRPLLIFFLGSGGSRAVLLTYCDGNRATYDAENIFYCPLPKKHRNDAAIRDLLFLTPGELLLVETTFSISADESIRRL